MPLTRGVVAEALEIIEKMKASGAEEAPIPRTPLLVVKTTREDDLPVERLGEYVIIQRGI